MNTNIYFQNKAQEMAKFLNRSSLITVISVLGGFTYDEVTKAVAGENDGVVIAMLATQLQLLETKVVK
jgi:hypothetical protein